MNVDPQQAKAIFLEAVEKLDPDQWPAFLDQACAGQPDVRRRVETLLEAHREAGTADVRADDPQPASADISSAAEQPGTIIGPYKLLEQIGEGGMGTVWMAQQTHPVKRVVALKLIKAGMDSKQVIARFEAERQALALMDHPNIAKVLDGGTVGPVCRTGPGTGEAEGPARQAGPTDPGRARQAGPTGRPYFVMDLVKGAPITKYCDEHHLTPRQRLELFIPVCQAVQHAHQKGIIHRDLKPSNVVVALYDGKPVPKVIDFGVAKAAGQPLTNKTLVTGFGNIVGTLEYMSPEQAEINQLDIDTRSDVYSLGVLVYELLTGSPPFSRKELEKAGMLEMLRVIREQEPAKPSTKLSTAEGLPTLAANRGTEPAKLKRLVRGELDWIVMKALEKDRNRRYETANGFAMDVQRFLADEPVQACPPSVGYRLLKFVRRNKGPVLAASLVLLALVGGILGTTWGMLRATDAEAAAVREAKEKETAMLAAQASERDARDQLFEALVSHAHAGRLSRQIGHRHDSLTALVKAAHIRRDERLRDEAIAALALPDVRLLPGWRSPQGTPTAVSYGGQYRLYGRVDSQGIISLRRIPEDDEIQRIASRGSLPVLLQFSPDERFLVSVGQDSTRSLWRVADGMPMLKRPLRESRASAFSPDGRRLAVGELGEVVLVDLASGQQEKRWRVRSHPSSLAFHPDNSKLAVGCHGHSIAFVYDVASASLLAELPTGSGDPIVAWHPDGERLAVGGYDPRIQIWNVAAKRKVAILEGHVNYPGHLTFHPDGHLLVSLGWDGLMFLWEPSTGRQLMRVSASRNWPQFSPNDRFGVIWHGDEAKLQVVTPSHEYRTLASSAAAGASYPDGVPGDISPDGRFLIMGMNGGAHLWDLRTGRELAALPAGTIHVAFEGGRAAPTGSDKPHFPTAVLTSGPAGLLRWPLAGNDSEDTGGPRGGSDRTPRRLRLGPPQRLSSLRRAWFARSPDGRTLAVVNEEGGANKLLNLKTGALGRELGPHPKGMVKALSPDGQWAASAGWNSDRVRLWNAETGQLVHEWPVSVQSAVCFTPDSRTLIIAQRDDYAFWDLARLQLVRRLPREVAQQPGFVAFSPDGRLMALEMAPAVIHLKEMTTGRTIAKLEDPHGDHKPWLAFTPDGTRLVCVVSRLAPAVHIWDLRAIRARLKEMNLDWDWPEFPPAATARAAEPLTIEVVLGGGVKAAVMGAQKGNTNK
ncbi:MAG: serine/threonine-protein kinase [Gemmataceae bacterium]|nr:serine/threonine-protein kinase [Gemmataceae bacterium]